MITLPENLYVEIQRHLSNFNHLGEIRKNPVFLPEDIPALNLAGNKLLQFLLNGNLNSICILSGPAGTGKTTLIANVLKNISNSDDIAIVLGAPTGKAAKVISSKTKYPANTIHHIIYNLDEQVDSKGNVLGFTFNLKPNESRKQTLFFIDEASMVSDEKRKEGFFLQNSLLDDLLVFIFKLNPSNKLVFIGDEYQLPPIGNDLSPALNHELLKNKGFDVKKIVLDKIYRQQKGSAILENATIVRNLITDKSQSFSQFEPIWNEGEFDFCSDFESAILDFVMVYENSVLPPVFLTYSNAKALKINLAIREKLQLNPNFPEIGENLMIVKNHYFKNAKKDTEFLANGENVALLEIHYESYELYAGMKWVDVTLGFENSKNVYKTYKHKILLDILLGSEASMSPEKMKLLQIFRRKNKNFSVFDPYLNAINLKYAYAITGHKSQGGEWKNIYLALENRKGPIEQYLKWVYTVFTRAKERIVIVKI